MGFAQSRVALFFIFSFIPNEIDYLQSANATSIKYPIRFKLGLI